MFKRIFKNMFLYTENTLNPINVLKITIDCTKYTNNAKIHSNVSMCSKMFDNFFFERSKKHSYFVISNFVIFKIKAQSGYIRPNAPPPGLVAKGLRHGGFERRGDAVISYF